MLEARQVNFGYGAAPLFLNTDLTLTPGHIHGLLGLNGAGKSTLLKLTAGLLFPDSGQIDACGYDPARRDPGFLAKVFLLPEDLNVPVSPARNSSPSARRSMGLSIGPKCNAISTSSKSPRTRD